MADDSAALLRRAAAALESDLEYLRACDPEAADEIRETVEDVRDLRALADALPRYDAALRLARAWVACVDSPDLSEGALAPLDRGWDAAVAAYLALGEEG